MGDLIKLFVTFAKMGLFTFGGGYAMLPMIKREVVEKMDGRQRMKLWIIMRLGK